MSWSHIATVLVSLIWISGASAQTIVSLPAPSEERPTSGNAKPTPAYLDFCHRLPAECVVDLSEPPTLELTLRIWRDLIAVNDEVNQRIKPMTDWEHWGVWDRWDFPDDGFGDCEDFQLLKRKILVDHGLPRRPMRMTVVLDGDGNGHAVLMVRTDRGDLILDNQRQAILPWKDTGYVYLKRESASGDGWVSLEAGASPSATATSED